jgi:DNA-binding CsgD family transcriptional regulator
MQLAELERIEAVAGSAARVAASIGFKAANDAYRGPERRAAAPSIAFWLAPVLDEIDYGMLLMGTSTQVMHVNHAAREQLDDAHPLQLTGSTLRAREAHDGPALHDALCAAGRGLRRLMTLGQAPGRVSVAVVPVQEFAAQSALGTLLVLGRRRVCQRLSVQWFARSHALTPAETRVLDGLCCGLDAREVATQHDVGLATVRTQISSLRAKTGAQSIRELVRQVAMLPPMVSTLRSLGS